MAAAGAPSLAEIERLCLSLYSPQCPSDERRRCELLLDHVFSPVPFSDVAVLPAQDIPLTPRPSVETSVHLVFTLLGSSSSVYAQLYALNSLTRNISRHFYSLDLLHKTELRNQLLNFAFGGAPTLNPHLVGPLTLIIGRVIKLGWFDVDEYRNTVDDLNRFIEASPEHCIIGLQSLCHLVTEMNQPSSVGTLARHRKTSAQFRDKYLLRIFQLGLTMLKQLRAKQTVFRDGSVETRMRENVLQLLKSCLLFDFIGTSPDELSEDSGTVQAPAAWRTDFEDADTVKVFFDCFAMFPTAQASQCMDCLVLLASVRRTIFASDGDRGRFLASHLRGIRDILGRPGGTRWPTQDSSGYHELCRLIARLKSQATLQEIVAIDVYPEWIDLVAAFTIESFRCWQYVSNSIQYLLMFWSKMVSSSGPSKVSTPHRLEQYTPQISHAFVAIFLDSLAQTASDDAEDLLENEETLVAQLDMFANFARFRYEDSCSFIVSRFDALAVQFQAYIQMGFNIFDPMALRRLEIFSRQFAWLVYIIGSMILSRTPMQSSDELDVFDAELSLRVFQLMSMTDSLHAKLGASNKFENKHLESGYLHFLTSLRKSYLGDQAPRSTKLYERLQSINISEQIAALNVIMMKIVTNLKFLPESETIVFRTLRLFQSLSTGSTMDPSTFALEFDLYPTFGTKVLGRAVALPCIFCVHGTNEVKSTGQAHVPVFDPKLNLIGEIRFEFAAIKPFRHPKLSIGGSIDTYWKTTKVVPRAHEPHVDSGLLASGAISAAGSNTALSTVVATTAMSTSSMAALGSLFPPLPAPAPAQPGASASLVTASSLSGEYVQLVVQVTSDGIPVICSENAIDFGPLRLPVSTIRASDFQSRAPEHARRPFNRERLSKLDARGVRKFAYESCMTLEEALTVLPKTVGFNIEIHGGQFGSTNAWDANAVVDRVLHLAYEEGGQGGRPIVFSSEDPLACTMLNWKQPNHAVFFATRAGYNADRGDNRRNSIKEAVRFARQENLLGIVCDARPLVQVPGLINAVKESGLVLVTFGPANDEDSPEGSDPNNASGRISIQKSYGVDGVMVRRVYSIEQSKEE